MSLAVHKYLRLREWRTHALDFATIAPLVGAVIAPIAVLMDIPALTERWFEMDGTPQPDPAASLVLSAVGLAFSVVANALLIVRFSVFDQRWRVNFAIPVSVLCWLVKVCVSTANLVYFGAIERGLPPSSFLEGFWCAVVSDIMSFLVLACLVLHYMTTWRRRKTADDPARVRNRQVQVSGRHFMLQTTWFIFLIGLTALIFSRIEGWSYYTGIYFAVVTFLTVGFGDFFPTQTATYILLFPLCLLGIASLGSLLDVIITFFSTRSAERKARSRALFERQRQEREDAQHDPDADIAREIAFLEKLNERQDVWDQALEFALSAGGFLVFWFVGALIFSAIEGWTYGIGLYFCYVFFLSIGYGDYAPRTPAGRVVFIVYSVLAVPVMASFAMQAVTQVFTRISTWRLERRRQRAGVSESTAAQDARVVAHAEIVAEQHARWDKDGAGNKDTRRSNADAIAGSDADADADADATSTSAPSHSDAQAQEDADLRSVHAGEEALVRAVLERAVALEMHARRLLVRHLPNGSRAQVILKADRNVQLRDLRFLLRRSERDEVDVDGAEVERAEGAAAQLDGGVRAGGTKEERVRRRREVAERLGLGEGAADEDADWVSRPLGDEETMEEVKRYREAFAGLLAAGSRLRKLEGEEQLMMERRKGGVEKRQEVGEKGEKTMREQPV